MTPHRVGIVVFEQAQLLDVAGPADVFSIASDFATVPTYRVVCLSAEGGPVRTSSGLALATRPIAGTRASAFDTLIVVGSSSQEGLVRACEDQRLARWVVRAAGRVSRLASVCTGAFALAHWGLLERRRATTHWSVGAVLKRSYPQIDVQADSLYVVDGKVWTSGGVTAGIDMCLAMLAQDHGRLLAARVARQLALTLRRVGNQTQFSVELDAQAGRYVELVEWMRGHLRHKLDVSTLAARARQSERTFCRRFTAETGTTPATFVELLRMGVAQSQLEQGASAKAAARSAGFTSAEHLARVFRRRLDMSPLAYRRANELGPHGLNRGAKAISG